MENEKNPLPQEDAAKELPQEEKRPWQKRKESWYDKVPLTVKQLDIIIGVACGLLALTFIILFLDVYGVF